MLLFFLTLTPLDFSSQFGKSRSYNISTSERNIMHDNQDHNTTTTDQQIPPADQLSPGSAVGKRYDVMKWAVGKSRN